MSDLDLLQCYTHDGSEAAFAELVARHLNLVYSVARRHVRSSHLAEEVAQSVFADLARHAKRIKSGTPLVAWLHLVSRRTAIDVVRRESRRQAREQAAAEIAAMKSNPPDWNAVEPLLDEAVEALDPLDRTAILLRYFEGKSLRDVGATLGSSEDAAQKRVSRAVEHLRKYFLRRGVAVTAATLTTDLSAHAIQAAPAALGTALSTSALTAATGAAASLSLTKAITMTLLQKNLMTGAIALAVGAGLYEGGVIFKQQTDVRLARQHNDTLRNEFHALGRERAVVAHRLTEVEAQIDARLAKPARPVPGSEAALEGQIRVWLAKLDRLKEVLEQRPALATPDLKMLPDETWITTASNADLDSDEGIRKALGELRSRADNIMANKISGALQAYLKANEGRLPEQPGQLLPFFDPPVDPASLARYEMLHAGRLSDVPQGDRGSGIMATASFADVEYDAIMRIGAMGIAMSKPAVAQIVRQAQSQFGQANEGQRATRVEQLTPYLKPTVDLNAVESYLRKRRGPGKQ